MAAESLVKGTTSYLKRVFIQDSSKTDGSGLTGLTSSSVASWKIYAARDDDGNAAGTGVSLQAGTRGTWSSGGFVEKDSTNMPGVYEIGIPNAFLATGSKSVTIMLKGATNMAPLVLEFELTGTDNQNANSFGLAVLPASAAPGAPNGLLIAGTNAPVTITGSGAALTLTSTGGNGAALALAGNGSGAGLIATGGATGQGVDLVGGATSGAGLRATGSAGNSNGVTLQGQGTADGLAATGGATGRGIHALGGATSGSGIRAEAVGTGHPGIASIGVGTGAGISAQAGATGNGIDALGGATSGSGLNAAATAGNSDGITATHQGSGKDINGTLTLVTNLTNMPTAAMTESYAADNVAPTPIQMLYQIWSAIAEMSISGTTITCNKIDGLTPSMTFTINDATNPTSRTRAT